MAPKVLAGVCVILAGLALAAPTATAAEPAVLTLTGAIAEPNRPPADPFRDSLFHALQEDFEHGHAFTRAELLDLPQQELAVEYPGWPRAVTVRGPRLLDVLKAAGGMGGDRVLVQALDGYAPEFALGDITADFVLALEAEGEPLGIGGRGPVWLVFPPDSYAGQDSSNDAGLAWAVFHIKVLDAE
jgi:hypothetical protein